MQALLDYAPVVLVGFAAVAAAYVAFLKFRVWKRKFTSPLITLNQASPAESASVAG